MYWFDTREGKLIVGDAAYESSVENSLPGDIRLLSELVLSKTIDFPTDHYERVNARAWDKEDYITYGRWIIKMLSSNENYDQFKRDYFDQLSKLRIGPSNQSLFKKAGPRFNDYLLALGEPLDFRRNDKYNDWTLRDYVNYARKLAKKLGRPATTDDFTAANQQKNGPSPWQMTQNAGTPGQINELIGYPNVYAWQREDYVAWGARVMAINDGTVLTARILTELSKRGRGPGFATVKDEFGSLSEFQRQIAERYHDDPTSRKVREARAQKSLRALVESKLINTWQLKYIKENDVDLIEFTAKFDVLEKLLSHEDKAEFGYIALDSTDDFVGNIKRIRQKTRIEDIQLTAVALGHTDDIWPLSEQWRDELLVA